MLYDIESTRTNALYLLSEYLRRLTDEERTRVITLDRQKHYRILELAVAFEHALLPWESMPPAALAQHDLVRYRPRRGADGDDGGALRFADYGIDAAAPDLSTVVQVKWHASRNPVSWRELCTFNQLATLIDAEQQGERLVVTSESVKLHNFATKMPVRHVELSNVRLQEICDLAYDRFVIIPMLDEYLSDIEVPAAAPAVAPTVVPAVVAPAMMQLRPYQEEAVRVLLDNLSKERITSAVMACGTGKTVVLSRVVSLFLAAAPSEGASRGPRCAVLVPSRLLLDQVVAAFARWAPELTVAQVGDGDHFSSTNDAAVTVCVYNSVSQLTAVHWDVVVVDEAHHMLEEILYAEFDEDDTYSDA